MYNNGVVSRGARKRMGKAVKKHKKKFLKNQTCFNVSSINKYGFCAYMKQKNI
jgi:hypothetical protein